MGWGQVQERGDPWRSTDPDRRDLCEHGDAIFNRLLVRVVKDAVDTEHY